jgi:hypothetical protein
MSWRVLVSAPYILPALEEFRPRLEREGIEVVRADVRERLSEEELLPSSRRSTAPFAATTSSRNACYAARRG